METTREYWRDTVLIPMIPCAKFVKKDKCFVFSASEFFSYNKRIDPRKKYFFAVSFSSKYPTISDFVQLIICLCNQLEMQDL